MIEQLNNNLINFAFFSDTTGQGMTGLTVTVDAWRVIISGGVPSATQILTNQAATEIGGGVYARVIASASVTQEGGYVSVFKTTNTSVQSRHLPALWMVNVAGVEYLDGSIANIPSNISGAFQEITIGDTVYIPYGSDVSVALGASVVDLEIPNFVNAIMMQATGANIRFTTDGTSIPTATTGWVLYNNQMWKIISFRDSKPDGPLKFLREASNAVLNYRFLRIQ